MLEYFEPTSFSLLRYETPTTPPKVAPDSSYCNIIGLQVPAAYEDDKVTTEKMRPVPKRLLKKDRSAEEEQGSAVLPRTPPKKKKLEVAQGKPVKMPLVFPKAVDLDDENEEKEEQGNDYVSISSLHDEG
ncbi:hypothetical protein ILUMI_10226 [Ignelater luminosus]|uniref:Uncharacterized protein n=1 Tax=Ignelater luminosus TaxID=2038154 RepID=A0A8K0GF66_IGNLU|nr:hypothetical protein ILUMI_10226 [Ignelater luminosus]